MNSERRLIEFIPSNYSNTLRKVAGTYRYAGDYKVEGALIGGILRAKVPHGKIRSLNVEGARAVKGVRTIITHQDVPGVNRFGYFAAEQPVLCEDLIMYEGDSIAAVAADSEDALADALRSILVEVEPLPAVGSIEEALEDKIRLRENGNIVNHFLYEKGSYSAAGGTEFKGSYLIGAVKPMYIELETSTAWFENGTLNIITTTQSPEHDIAQISRSLNLSPDNIHLTYPDPGGAFGGKEEIHSQIIAGLLSMKTGKPVKLQLSREDSNVSTTRRHAFKFDIKLKVKDDMGITGLDFIAVGDAGAYISHGPGVIEVAAGHAAGPYFIPNVRFEGMLVHTNYPPSGGMRGYGATEVNFALERHMDMVSRERGWDPLEFRLRNALKPGMENGTGLVPISTVKATETIEAARMGNLWSARKRVARSPFVRVGIGTASGMKSTSYGQGGDSAAVRITIGRGRVKVYFTTPDMGTGIRESISRIASSALGIPMEYIEVDNYDSNFPPSGTSNASRVTFIIGNATLDAAKNIKEKAKSRFGERTGLELLELTMDGIIEAEGHYSLPKVEGGVFKKGDMIYSFITTVARVEVNALTGEIKVTDLEIYPEAGNIINEVSFHSQMEGGAIMSMGYAVYENLKFLSGRVRATNFTTYMLPTVMDSPRILVEPVRGYEPLGPMGVKGAGELPLVSITPAIVNAIVDATNRDLRKIPVEIDSCIGAAW
ncbi:MAG: xanthine dehydrogenase family protein molybdopterin-binding subunit [Nitrososphaerota archaeon]|nr:xanthine dehydrogenase family protein molybdopterin-binding subunit [Nitrososphaerota archaeon]MDG7038291.1 xanthine dehydrogenase family protein molybdopterin-binding subunit [Nitrososphaerota archaeon]